MMAPEFRTERLPISGTSPLICHFWVASGRRHAPAGFGLCLMGGGPKCPEALRWMAVQAGHGHLVVLDVRDHPDELTNPDSTTRSLAQGAGFQRLTTLVVDTREKADHAVMREFLEEADAVFSPGGDQTRYGSTWQGTLLQSVLNHRLTSRSLVLGGSSAGMHVMGGMVHTPGAGRSVTSSLALANPYLEADPEGGYAGMTLQEGFLRVPFLQDSLTDTHWSERDRMGRSMAFLARILQDGLRPLETASVLACDEGVAVCIDQEGKSRVFGPGSGHAFHITATCLPQVCRPGEPLTWFAPEGALLVQSRTGTLQGDNALDQGSLSRAEMEGARFNLDHGQILSPSGEGSWNGGFRGTGCR